MGWFETTKAGESRDTGQPKTDTYFGPKGSDSHGHIAHNASGDVVVARDVDGSSIPDSSFSSPSSSSSDEQ